VMHYLGYIFLSGNNALKWGQHAIMYTPSVRQLYVREMLHGALKRGL